jgi:putative transposase
MVVARFCRSAGGVTSLGLHVVRCLKYRRRLLGGRAAVQLSELLDDIAGEHGWQIVAPEFMPNHVHVFVRVHPTDSPAGVARRFEGSTSRFLRAEFPWLDRTKVLWSRSNFAPSVGCVSDQTVRRFIEHQWDTAA